MNTLLFATTAVVVTLQGSLVSTINTHTRTYMYVYQLQVCIPEV